MFVNQSVPKPLIDLSINILEKTQQCFSKGSCNRYLDIFEYALEKDIHKLRSDEVVALTPVKKNPYVNHIPQSAYFMHFIKYVSRSYKHNYGNCGEMASVAMYIAATDGRELLKAASLIVLDIDHGILQIEDFNGNKIFIDPWYKTLGHNGAVIDECNFDYYFRKLIVLDETNSALLAHASSAKSLVSYVMTNRPLLTCIVLAAIVCPRLTSRIFITETILVHLLQSIMLSKDITLGLLQQLFKKPLLHTATTIRNTGYNSFNSFKLFTDFCNLSINKAQILKDISTNNTNSTYMSRKIFNYNP